MPVAELTTLSEQAQELSEQAHEAFDREFEKLIETVSTEQQLHVLFLEDDVKLAQQTVDYIRRSNIHIHHVNSPEGADLILEQHDIDMAIVDLRLAGFDTSGEDWICANADRLRGVFTVVLSAHLGEIRNEKALGSVVDDIIEKGSEEAEELLDFPVRLIRNRILAHAHKKTLFALEQEYEELSPKNHQYDSSSGEILHPVILNLFRKWVSRFADADKGMMLLGEKEFSMNDLLREVEQESDTGKRILALFARDLDESI